MCLAAFAEGEAWLRVTSQLEEGADTMVAGVRAATAVVALGIVSYLAKDTFTEIVAPVVETKSLSPDTISRVQENFMDACVGATMKDQFMKEHSAGDLQVHISMCQS